MFQTFCKRCSAGQFEASWFRCFFDKGPCFFEFDAEMAAFNSVWLSRFFALHLDEPRTPFQFHVHYESFVADPSAFSGSVWKECCLQCCDGSCKETSQLAGRCLGLVCTGQANFCSG